MNQKTFVFKTADNKEIYSYKWLPDNENNIKAVLQISHGMAEYSARYCEFAGYLVNNGFAVYSNDHRGHGKTAELNAEKGYFSEKNGWQLAVEDMHKLAGIIRKEHPGKPVFLLGHSMGSFLSLNYGSLYGSEISGLLLSGTRAPVLFTDSFASMITRIVSFLLGNKSRTRLLLKLFFGRFNESFAPNVTKYDFFTRDIDMIKKYMEDRYCGNYMAVAFFRDLLAMMGSMLSRENLANMPKNLPVYLFSGEKDPVGNFTKGVEKVRDILVNAGINDVTCRFYPGGRHEMLNEINRQEVYSDILGWLNKKIDNQAAI